MRGDNYALKRCQQLQHEIQLLKRSSFMEIRGLQEEVRHLRTENGKSQQAAKELQDSTAAQLNIAGMQIRHFHGKAEESYGLIATANAKSALLEQQNQKLQEDNDMLKAWLALNLTVFNNRMLAKDQEIMDVKRVMVRLASDLKGSQMRAAGLEAQRNDLQQTGDLLGEDLQKQAEDLLAAEDTIRANRARLIAQENKVTAVKEKCKVFMKACETTFNKQYYELQEAKKTLRRDQAQIERLNTKVQELRQEKAMYRQELVGGMAASVHMPSIQRNDQSAEWKACAPGGWEIGTGNRDGSSWEMGVEYDSGDEITIELITGLFVTC